MENVTWERMMSKFVLIYLSAAFALVTSHPLLQGYLQQCQCPASNYQQNQLLNTPLNIPHQHTVTPQLINQAYNALVQNPNQCIPVRDQENQQFLNKVLENPLIKALQEQNRQQYQNPVQNSGQPPHVVNNYFIIPTEALLSEDADKIKRHKPKDGRNNKERTNHQTDKIHKTSRDEIQAFLNEHFNEETEEPNLKSESNKNLQALRTVEPQECSKNEQPVEVELEPTFAKILERDEPKAIKVPTKTEAEEAVIQDVRNQFPNMPEALVRSLVSIIRPRFQRFNPYQNHRHPHCHRHVALNQGNSTIDESGKHWNHVPGQRKTLKRNPNRRRNGSKKNHTNASRVEGTTKKYEVLDLKEASKVKPTAAEIYRHDETTTENPKRAEIMDDDNPKDKVNASPHIIYASHYDKELPELGSEYRILNVDNGIKEDIKDDYYPDFTKDNKALTMTDTLYSYPDFYDEVLRSERRITNNREHRSNVLDGKKTPKKVMRKFSERQNQAKYINDKRNDDKSEEIVYKVPPSLENPDFKTVNVREYQSREFQRPTYFSHEFIHSKDGNEVVSENEVNSSNDEPVITYYLPNKPAVAIRKRPTEKLETVFANSKIVNYGQSSDVFGEETTTIENVFSIDLGGADTKNPFENDAVDTAKTNVEHEDFNW